MFVTDYHKSYQLINFKNGKGDNILFKKLFIILYPIYLILVSCSPSLELQENADYSFEQQLNNLTNQIVESLTQNRIFKIAIIEFSDLNGNISEFGKYLSEELTLRIFMLKKFEIVERQLLQKVVDEQKLGVTVFIDDNSAVSLGKILGVDAIATGTITDLGNYVKINARLISTETGSVFSVASVKLIKDNSIINLMKKKSKSSSFISNNSKTQKKDSERNLPESIFYYEDFSNIEDGLIPESWLGASTLAVRNSSKIYNRKFLTNFQRGDHSFTIPNINFPENFIIEIELMNYNGLIKLDIGNINIGLKEPYSWIGEAKFKYEESKEIFIFKLEKLNDVFRVFINGKEVKTIRKSDFRISKSINFEIKSNNFGFYKIVGYRF